MFGVTRENISGNALGIGVALGCMIGGVLLPNLRFDGGDNGMLDSAAADAFSASNSTSVPDLNTTTSSSAPLLHTTGLLSVYIKRLTSFSSLSPSTQWSTLLSTFLLLLLLRLLYQWTIRPFEYIRTYGKEKRLEAAYLRLAGNIPPGYPITWYKICDEYHVPPYSSSRAHRVNALGESLILIRLPKIHPFDKDEFKENDVVVMTESSIPKGCNILNQTDLMSKCDTSKNTSLKVWKSKEINRMVFIWYHDENLKDLEIDEHETRSHSNSPKNENDTTTNDNNNNNNNEKNIPDKILTTTNTTTSTSPSHTGISVPPNWEIPLIAGMEGWSYHGSVTHEIACHIQEIPENGADVAHLEYVHGDFLLSWLGRIVRHEWEATWDPLHDPVGHIARLVLTQQVTICGYSIPLTKLDSRIDQVGPALVQLIFPTPFGRIAIIETITPIQHTLQRAQNCLYAEPTVPRFLAKLFLMGLVVQFERDLPIWNYKQFLRKPLIVREDGPILKYRRWMRQFYANADYQQELKKNSDALMKFANEE